MDRIIVYPGAIPLDTDMLNTNRNVMLALHGLLAATLGSSTQITGTGVAGTAVDGFVLAPTLPNSMQVVVGPGTITQLAALDSTPYGSLPSDLNDAVYKMGVQVSAQTVTVPAPTTPGTQVAYLIEAGFTESDQSPVVLPYYNAANPAQPYLGPGNSGAAQATVRRQTVTLQVRGGAPSAPGTQLPPSPDVGFVALGIVTVAYGQSAITASNITVAPLTRLTPWKLPDLTPGFAFAEGFTSSGLFTVPPQITRLRVTATGAGGGGGGSSAGNAGGGGGGAGGRATAWLYNVVPGSQFPVTVGNGGSGGGSGASGGGGGTSSFSIYCSATGGAGGGGGSAAGPGLGGNGGTVSLNPGGTWQLGANGGSGIPGIACGGSGGGPGNGNGGVGSANGSGAPGYGGGGGGGSGAGFSGGNGGSGLVLVEW
jgi:hypothetical protein